MSLSRLLMFVIGAVLAFVGLMLVIQSPTQVMPNLVIGLVLIVVGVVIFSGRVVSL